MKAQVIIVGGGPAGSTTAYSLACQGFDVCVIEKYHMPRYKTCGGGVNVRAARLLPFTIEPVVERVISHYRFTFCGEHPFERQYTKPLTYMTQRMNLDKYLLDQASSVGARIAEGVTVRKVISTSDHVAALTDNGETYEAQVVVGADGANSVVARDLGLMKDVRREIALESEIELTSSEMDKWQDMCEVDLFSLRYGYGWVFPKGQHISIGVGGLQESVKQVQQYNKEYLQRHGLVNRKPIRYSGHALPVRIGRSSIVQGRGVLVGDAAGLVEPFTGEGIGYAVQSGQLAAAAIGDFLRGGLPNLNRYGEDLDAEITPELVRARRLVEVFNRHPRIFYHMIRESDYVWNAICLILRGERRYADIDRRLGMFRHALAWL